MGKDKKRKKRLNINFRQTSKAFKSAKQTQIFSHINRNLPYNVYKMSKNRFLNQLQKINRNKKIK